MKKSIALLAVLAIGTYVAISSIYTVSEVEQADDQVTVTATIT